MTRVLGMACSTASMIKKPPRMSPQGLQAAQRWGLEAEHLVQLWTGHRMSMPPRLRDGEVHSSELREGRKHSALLVVSTVCRKGRLRHIFHAPGESLR
jgi:hypothetical protein